MADIVCILCEKHLLEGIVRTCTMMVGMEDYRLYCEEISLPFLEVMAF